MPASRCVVERSQEGFWQRLCGVDEIRVFVLTIILSEHLQLHGMQERQPCLATKTFGPLGALWECQVVIQLKSCLVRSFRLIAVWPTAFPLPATSSTVSVLSSCKNFSQHPENLAGIFQSIPSGVRICYTLSSRLTLIWSSIVPRYHTVLVCAG